MQSAGMSVEVRTVTIYVGPAGDLIVEVGGVEAPTLGIEPSGTSSLRKYFGVKLSNLLEAGLLEAGEKLRFHLPKKAVTFWATVLEGGVGLRVDDQDYASPSAAAIAAAEWIQSSDGWRAWEAERDGSWVKLGDLREEYLSLSARAGREVVHEFGEALDRLAE